MRIRPITSHVAVTTARRTSGSSAFQRSFGRPTAPSAPHHARETCAFNFLTLRPLRRPLAQQTLGTEHEDQDQDREDERLGPVAPRRVPGEPFVERLDEADHECAEYGAREVPDPAEDGCGERDQA